MGKIGIEAIRPELLAAGGEGLNLFALRQPGAPDLPERIVAYHLLAVALDAPGAFGENSFAPLLARVFVRKSGVRKNMAGDGRGPEYVEVMDLAEQVLHFFEVVAPGLVFRGQEILDDVAEALDADAEAVKGSLGAVTQGAVVEFAGFGPAFESQMFEERAAEPNARGTSRKNSRPLTPLLAVEFFESGMGFELLLFFACGED